jgi:hypothetical protein
MKISLDVQTSRTKWLPFLIPLSASEPETKSHVPVRSLWWSGGTPNLLCKLSLNEATDSVECALSSTTPSPATVLKWI